MEPGKRLWFGAAIGDRRAHNPKVAGSNPAPATNEKARNPKGFRVIVVLAGD
jgi:hypothetical protein